LEAAVQRYGSATFKAPVATVLDPNGKLTITLSYGELLTDEKPESRGVFLNILIQTSFDCFFPKYM
jgi:hypothetical protein